MTLTELAINDPDAFVALCDRLRARGVVKLGALVLGQLPTPARSVDREVDPDAAEKQKHAIMFAACRTKPPFVPRVIESDTPRAVVQRQARDEAPRGQITRR